MSSGRDRRLTRLRAALRDDPFVPEPGMLVGSKVRLVRLLEEGGMGSVWVAEHLGLRARVAVKFMLESASSRPEALERFEREATAAAGIRSPHVVQVHDHGLTGDDTPYIVMELLEGEDLRRRLARAGPIDLATTLEIVRQVAKALVKAHGAGIVHRDIKPANIFLCDVDGEVSVKLLDFGVAKSEVPSTVATTATGSTLGTPMYMSPEQVISAKNVDHRCDLWSLAVVAYECLTSRAPFQGETVGALSIAIDRAVFRPPSELAPVPPAVDAWFARALDRDPDQRFDTAKTLADELAIAVRAGGAGTPGRGRMRWMLAAASLFCVAAGAAVLLPGRTSASGAAVVDAPEARGSASPASVVPESPVAPGPPASADPREPASPAASGSAQAPPGPAHAPEPKVAAVRAAKAPAPPSPPAIVEPPPPTAAAAPAPTTSVRRRDRGF